MYAWWWQPSYDGDNDGDNDDDDDYDDDSCVIN